MAGLLHNGEDDQSVSTTARNLQARTLAEEGLTTMPETHTFTVSTETLTKERDRLQRDKSNPVAVATAATLTNIINEREASSNE